MPPRPWCHNFRNRRGHIFRNPHRRAVLLSEVAEIQEFVASLLDRDPRTPEETLGYDEFGLPV